MELKWDIIVSQILAPPTSHQIKMFLPLWVPFHSFFLCRGPRFPLLATPGWIPFWVLPSSLNMMPKACVLALLFIFLVWFCITAKSIVLNISPLCPAAPLCESSPPHSWPAQPTSAEPQARSSRLTSTSNLPPSAYLSP